MTGWAVWSSHRVRVVAVLSLLTVLTVLAVLTPAAAALSVPVRLTPTNGATNVAVPVTFTWQAVEGAKGYYIHVATNETFSPLVAAKSLDGVTSMQITGLAANTHYWWRILAYDAGTGHSEWSTGWGFYTAGLPTVAPTLLQPANGATGLLSEVKLKWTAVEGATAYAVQISPNETFAAPVTEPVATTTELVIHPSAGQKYYWRVAAKNNAGRGPWSATWNFKLADGPATAPTLLSPANGATGVPVEAMTYWSEVAGATGYQVVLSKSETFAPYAAEGNPTGHYQSFRLEPGTKYWWRVAAKNAAGRGPWSAVWTFTTATPLTAAPQLLSPPNNAQMAPPKLTLTWSAVAEATGYKLQLATNEIFTQGLVEYPTTGTSKVVELRLKTKYWWRVAALNAGGRGPWSSVRYLTTAAPPVPAPVLVSPANAATGVAIRPTLVWQSVVGAYHYRVVVVKGTDSAHPVVDQTISGTALTVTLEANTNYRWAVAGVNVAGQGPWSAVWTFATAVPPTVAPLLISPANGDPAVGLTRRFSWSPVDGVPGYMLQVATDEAFTNIVCQRTISVTVLEVSGLAPATVHYWRVAAMNYGGIGPWSEVWSFTTRN